MVVPRIRTCLQERGVAELFSHELPRPDELQPDESRFVASWNNLVQDPHMGDGGTYRKRRYSRFLLDSVSCQLSPLPGTSIYQTLEHNPLNGGVERTFQPLEQETQENLFLHHVIWFDWSCLPVAAEELRTWIVGVHQVRIVARAGAPGKPSPEGVHIDGESFTIQHLIQRNNVKGGIFNAYDAEKRPTFHWIQLRPWESLFFTGQTWHDATPVECRDPLREGSRDVLLIDFTPEP